MSTNDWMSQLNMLPPEDRAEIAFRLIQTLDDAPVDADWEAAWMDELRKRSERMQSGETKGIPFDDVMAKLRQKYS